jgi:hypothetical protein
LSAKITKLENLTQNSCTQTKSASTIATVTAAILTHPEVMGLVAQGNYILIV